MLSKRNLVITRYHVTITYSCFYAPNYQVLRGYHNITFTINFLVITHKGVGLVSYYYVFSFMTTMSWSVV